MITPQLLEYIKTELGKGQTTDTIRTTLINQGWQVVEINQAFQSLTTQSPALPKTQILNHSSKNGILLGVVLFIIAIGLGSSAFYFLHSSQTKMSLTTPTKIPDPTIMPGITSQAVITANEAITPSPVKIETAIYSSTEQGYSFTYPKSWKIQTQGTATSLVSPESKNSIFGDVIVSKNPYMGSSVLSPNVTMVAPTIPSIDQQIIDLANQLASDKKITPVTVGQLKGYEATSTTPDGSTYNILLQGTKGFLMIQYPSKKSRAELDQGQLIILNSFIEL